MKAKLENSEFQYKMAFDKEAIKNEAVNKGYRFNLQKLLRQKYGFKYSISLIGAKGN